MRSSTQLILHPCTITYQPLQGTFSLSRELQEPIVLSERGDVVTLEGGMHRVVSYVCVCLGLLPYENKHNKIVRASPHIFTTDDEKEFDYELLSLTEGFLETFDKIEGHHADGDEAPDEFTNNYHTLLKMILKHDVVQSPYCKDDALIPVEDPLRLQMTLSNIKLPVVRVSYLSKRVHTDNCKLASRVSKGLAVNAGLSKDHRPTDLIQIMFFNEQPNNRLHDVLCTIPCSIDAGSCVFPNGTFWVDSQCMSPSILMCVITLAQFDEETSSLDVVPRHTNFSGDPIKQEWLTHLLHNTNTDAYVESAQRVATQLRWVVDEFGKMYQARSGRAQSTFCQLVKTEIAKRNKNRMGHLFSIVVCLLVRETISVTDIAPFLMSHIHYKGRSVLMMKHLFTCLDVRLRTLGVYAAPFQFESVVRHCNTVATLWKDGTYVW